MIIRLTVLLWMGVAGIVGEDFNWSPEYSSQATGTTCKPLKRYHSSGLKTRVGPSLNMTSLGSVVNSEVCGLLCCEIESCDLAEFQNHRCYAIKCNDLKSCEMAPDENSEIITFARKSGTDIWTKGLKEDQTSTATNLVKQRTSVPKSSIPVEGTRKDLVISPSTKDKVETPMDQLLKEELEIVHKKELEKEKAWIQSVQLAGKKSALISNNLGNEIQAITGEHYLKAEDKSDITALQENDTTTAHSKLHPHRRDLRHTLISPITIGAFTCMAVIAVSGFVMAIIKYKKEKKELEDKETQSP